MLTDLIIRSGPCLIALNEHLWQAEAPAVVEACNEEKPVIDDAVERRRKLVQEAAGEVLGAGGIHSLGITQLITEAGGKLGGNVIGATPIYSHLI